ncbi:DUF6009 family protein [Streptomyces sp. NPDC088350]|uniref:DUF6009 family protein n=1 Tax=Streptomyces sp. NPDC088350 TaxID=3365854 RepID=UPI0037FFC51C
MPPVVLEWEARPSAVGPRLRGSILPSHDRDSLPGGLYREGAPGEAVDPRTIEVKKVGGEETSCSQSGPAAITGSRS